jgi:hypothetical protein
MSTARNAPCPCGSGQKFKRCCADRARHRAADVRREERVGREGEEWAFAQFGDELIAAGLELTRRLAGSSQATWITWHWVMLDYELRGGATAAGRYAALPRLSPADRDIATRIARSRVGVHRVLSSRPGDGLDLADLLRGGQVTVASAGVSRQAADGDLLVARIMDGPSRSLWGPARVFSPRHAGVLVDEVTRLAGQDCEQALRDNWPTLMTLDTTHPRLVARAAWDIDDPGDAFDALPDALEYDRLEDGADVFLWRIGPGPADYGGFFELYRDGIVVWTYSESLLADAIALIERALGPRARLAERETVPLTPAHRRDVHRRPGRSSPASSRAE